MKQTYKLLILSLITGLLIPVGVFAKPTVAQHSTSFHQAAASGPILEVVAAPPTAVVAVTAQAASFCSLDTILTSNLVQDTSLINFNQSADCFTVQSAQLSVLQQLAVTSAISTATVAVNKATTSWNQLRAVEPLPSAVPALPAVGLVLLVMAGAITFGLIRRQLLYRSSKFIQALSLSQLQMMRC